MTRLAVLSILLQLLGTTVLAQPQSEAQKPPDQKPQTVTRAHVREVLLDLVVRDKRGRLVRDLKPEEVQIEEEGTPQGIASFRIVDGGQFIQQGVAGKAAEAKPLDPMRQIRLVMLTFDRLGPEARRLSRRAVLDMLKEPLPQNLFYAVAWLNPGLMMIQPFTSERDLLRRAVERVTGGAAITSTELRVPREEQVEAPDPSANPGAAAAAGAGTAFAAAAMQRVIQQMTTASVELDRAQQGSTAITGLKAIIDGLGVLDGRKSILYFTEGLELPQPVLPQFDAMIGHANRTNVSIYTVDARGLDLSPQVAANRRGIIMESRQVPHGLVNTYPGIDTDTAVEAIRRNVQGNLQELADATGGFLVADTNDLRGPMDRINEDAFTYYELSYVPENVDWDGRFRRISVKVTRPDSVVQSRSGYFALPPELAGTLFPHEVPLLRALGRDAPPQDVEFRSKAFRFRRSDRGVLCSFDIEFPIRNLAVEREEGGKSFHSHVSFLAFFRDSEGKPVRKISRDVPFQAPVDRLEAFQAGSFSYTDFFELPPGRYTMETAVMDRRAEKIAVRRAVVILPPVAPGISLSDLVVIRRVDEESSEAQSDAMKAYTRSDPFRFKGGRIVPSLRSAIPAGPAAQLGLYFVVYPDPASDQLPTLTLEFYFEGALVAQAQPALPPADEDGRIPYVAMSSVGNLKPGQYEVRVIVQQGGASAVAQTTFAIVE